VSGRGRGWHNVNKCVEAAVIGAAKDGYFSVNELKVLACGLHFSTISSSVISLPRQCSARAGLSEI
jgi:hypothetical protein